MLCALRAQIELSDFTGKVIFMTESIFVIHIILRGANPRVWSNE